MSIVDRITKRELKNINNSYFLRLYRPSSSSVSGQRKYGETKIYCTKDKQNFISYRKIFNSCSEKDGSKINGIVELVINNVNKVHSLIKVLPKKGQILFHNLTDSIIIKEIAKKMILTYKKSQWVLYSNENTLKSLENNEYLKEVKVLTKKHKKLIEDLEKKVVVYIHELIIPI